MAHTIRQPVVNGRFELGAERPPQLRDRSFTGFLKCIGDAKNGNRQEQYIARGELEKNYKTGYASVSSAVTKGPMSETSGTVGGYLVPPDFTLQLMEVIAENSFIYPRAQVVPMGAAVMDCPVVDVTTVQSSGTTPLFGGVLFSWGLENTPTETEPTFRTMELRAWDLLGYAKVSNQLLMDMGPLGESYLIKLFGKAAAWYAEYAFLQGTGTAFNMPLGVLNSPASIIQSRSGASHIIAADVTAMAADLLPFSWHNCIWACSPTAAGDIMKIAGFTINRPTTDDWRHAAGCLLGRMLFVTDKLPPLGTQGDLVLFDPWLYVIGNRMEVVIDVSQHALFQTNQTEFRVWMRLDGKPQVNSTITLADASTVVSPYVVLKK